MTEILTAIGDYGISFVIAAIAIYGVFRIMNVYIGKIEASVQSSKDEKKKEEKEHKELIEVRRVTDSQIRTSLDRLLLRTGASRAFVFEFHNGGTNICGLPFLRMTNTYESLSAGMPTRLLSFGQLPSSILHSAAGDLLLDANTYICVGDEDEEAENTHHLATEYMRKVGIDTTVLARITSVSGTVLGFCGIDFHAADADRNIADLQTQVGIVAIELGGLLSVN